MRSHWGHADGHLGWGINVVGSVVGGVLRAQLGAARAGIARARNLGLPPGTGQRLQDVGFGLGLGLGLRLGLGLGQVYGRSHWGVAVDKVSAVRGGLRLQIFLLLGGLLLLAFIPLFFAVATYTSVTLQQIR